MQEKVNIIEIKTNEELKLLNPSNIHCVYLGDDCVHFRAYTYENNNIVCYRVADTVQKDIATETLKKFYEEYSAYSHYLGMGHDVRMREEYFKSFEERIKNAEFLGYRESFGILFDLIKHKSKEN